MLRSALILVATILALAATLPASAQECEMPPPPPPPASGPNA